MVGEFPELQGIMGEYYARHDGEPDDVALAIREHYQPRYAGDALPSTPVRLAVALADKMETLTVLFGIGQMPTGEKDPFALRRHALGVVVAVGDPHVRNGRRYLEKTEIIHKRSVVRSQPVRRRSSVAACSRGVPPRLQV